MRNFLSYDGKLRILPPDNRIEKDIMLPFSKSISNRVLIIRALSGSTLPVRCVSDCDDSQVVVEALRDMPEVIDVKAAGTAMRFLTAMLSAMEGETHVITGTERMRNRPIGVLVDALRSIGAEIDYEQREGYPPLRITGKRLMGGRVTLSGNVSSQYISALLMIGPTLQDGLVLELTGGIISRPYIDMTLALMCGFGAKAYWLSESEIRVEAQPYVFTSDYTIESDWSAASYWYEIVALCGGSEAKVALPGLCPDSIQGDSVVRELFADLGVGNTFSERRACIFKTGHVVRRFERDMNACPDLAQTVVVTCCMLGVPFRIGGLQTLRIKETDRLAALQKELFKLGFVVGVDGDHTLYWEGETCAVAGHPQDVVIDTYDDHRMAMAFAPVALKRGSILINNPEVVDKSYPAFWHWLYVAGFKLTQL